MPRAFFDCSNKKTREAITSPPALFFDRIKDKD